MGHTFIGVVAHPLTAITLFAIAYMLESVIASFYIEEVHLLWTSALLSSRKTIGYRVNMSRL